MFVYWLVGAFFDDLETLTLSVGLIRSFESLGSCVSYGVGAAKVKAMTNLILAFAMLAVAVPTTTLAVLLVPERPVDDAKPTASDESGDEDLVVAGKAVDAAAEVPTGRE